MQRKHDQTTQAACDDLVSSIDMNVLSGETESSMEVDADLSE